MSERVARWLSSLSAKYIAVFALLVAVPVICTSVYLLNSSYQDNKRALTRLLGRPVGLSGSGPTLWALYPSEGEATVGAEVVRSALRAGDLAAPGATEPFVTAHAQRC